MNNTALFENDTIAAIATPAGEGGIAIIRISGNDALKILKTAFKPAGKKCAFEDKRLMYGHVLGETGEVIDEVMAVYMAAPHTYTREDVAEIQCHGGRISARRVLSRVFSLGARPAGSGEFTKRAFFNGRIDLSRAEAVMQLIGAGSEAAARYSVRQLEGGVSSFVADAQQTLTGLIAQIEAATDFPDEVDEEPARWDVLNGINALVGGICARVDEKGARVLREGASIVLCGRPNVGKSSLLNAILHQDRAIVTPVAGTTRDVLREKCVLGGIEVTISDTAGQRDTSDEVEAIGVERARNETRSADIVLLLMDTSQPLQEEDLALAGEADGRYILCANKADLACCWRAEEKFPDFTRFEISAANGCGVDELVEEICLRLGRMCASEDALIAQRHINLAKQAVESLNAAKEAIEFGFPLDTAAMDLMAALSTLGEITGDNASEGVIDRVFKDFCVGK